MIAGTASAYAIIFVRYLVVPQRVDADVVSVNLGVCRSLGAPDVQTRAGRCCGGLRFALLLVLAH